MVDLLGDSIEYPYLYHRHHLRIPKELGGFLHWNSEGIVQAAHAPVVEYGYFLESPIINFNFFFGGGGGGRGVRRGRGYYQHRIQNSQQFCISKLFELIPQICILYLI